MLRKATIGTILAFFASVILLLAVWTYQRRTLSWSPVQIEITSSKIEFSRERDRNVGRVWTATVNYTFDGQDYTKTIRDLPLDATQIYVDPNNPANVVGERGPTARALFIPIIAVAGTSLFGLVLILIKLSPSDD